MSCSFLLIPTRFPTLSSYNKDIISATLLGFSSFSCLRNGRRSNSSATCISKRRRLGCKCQLADLAPVTSAAYGVILLGGGLFAFGKSGSKGSLFGGLTGAALMGTAYFLMQAPETKAIGDSLGFGSAFLFSSVFGKSFLCSECPRYLDVGHL
ncbi:protein FATTY ACID EXPORT 4 [Populus alba x Populus x berolinensis]|nr:protein FATTY ACID EXPORT 4 [Populus alba x Populus x berolinensis]